MSRVLHFIINEYETMQVFTLLCKWVLHSTIVYTTGLWSTAQLYEWVLYFKNVYKTMQVSTTLYK